MEASGTTLLAGLNGGSKGLKERIIAVLSAEWPLSAKQVFYKISKEPGASITYQGVHKALNSLHADGILVRGEGGYSLDRRWLSQVYQQMAAVISSYDSKEFSFFSSTGSGRISSTFQSLSLLKKLLFGQRLIMSRDQVFLFGNRICMLPMRLCLNWFVEIGQRSPTRVYESCRELGVYWYGQLRERGALKNRLEEDVAVGIETLSFAGWGGASLELVELPSRKVRFTIDNSSFAAEYLNVFGKSRFPVDDIVRGLVTGGMRVVLGDDSLEGVETSCVAAGSQNCVFEIKPRKQFDKRDKLVRRQLNFKIR